MSSMDGDWLFADTQLADMGGCVAGGQKDAVGVVGRWAWISEATTVPAINNTCNTNEYSLMLREYIPVKSFTVRLSSTST